MEFFYRKYGRHFLIFCLQTSDEIESLKIKDSRGNSRIHRLEEFNELVIGVRHE